MDVVNEWDARQLAAALNGNEPQRAADASAVLARMEAQEALGLLRFTPQAREVLREFMLAG